MKPQVDFVVAGAQKSGTQALRQFLSWHSEIGLPMPNIQEPHYFDRKIHEDDSPNYDVYHEMFSKMELGKVAGDVTPIYIFKEDCVGLIQEYNPNMKFIIILRDPVEHAFSQWQMDHGSGLEHRSFVPAIMHEIFFSLWLGKPHARSYIQRGFYGRQLKRLFAHISPEQCLILLTSQMRNYHAESLRLVYAFLGVSEIIIPPQKSIHAREYTPISRVKRRLLQLFYRRDTRHLEALTGLDCTEWRGCRNLA